MVKYILIILFFLSSVSFAQNISSEYKLKLSGLVRTDTLYTHSDEIKGTGTCKLKEDNPWKNILWMEGAVLAYGGIDYVAYNSMKNGNIEHYRFLQGVTFATINYFLAEKVSHKAAIGFSLQVWGGVPDMYYYGIDKVGKGFGGFSNGNELNPHKNLSQLNFMPTVIGSKNVRMVDLITNNILSKVISIAIQF
jgi:hypothetical protein